MEEQQNARGHVGPPKELWEDWVFTWADDALYEGHDSVDLDIWIWADGLGLDEGEEDPRRLQHRERR